MFDVGFGELLLVSIIGLVVIGPERLPSTIKAITGWIKTLRSLVASVQNELSHELKLQSLQDSLKKAEQAGLQNLTPELKRSINELKEATQIVTTVPNSPLVIDRYDNEDNHSLPDVPSMPQAVPVQSALATKFHEPLVSKDKKIALPPVSIFQKAGISDKSNDDC